MTINLSTRHLARVSAHLPAVLTILLSLISVGAFYYYYQNGLGLAYNDARSHLDIGRRVVESLQPGLAQLGSVWLPLPHLLMIPTIWHDTFWYSGLAGALQSMIAFVATGLLIYKFLEKLKVGILARLIGVAVFVANLNVLYMQSTAMTELLLLATMTAGCYFLLIWHQTDDLFDLITSGFFIMLSTLVRYDGWFLLTAAVLIIFIRKFVRFGWARAEGTAILFGTLAGLGIVLWLGWNLLIFKDPLYFAFGPYSAHTQQAQLAAAGELDTKGDLWRSIHVYLLALFYNSYTLPVFLGLIGAIFLWTDRHLTLPIRTATLALLAPLAFNIIALYFGHSVLFVQGINGTSWFNVRYGMMLMPSLAIFIGYLVHKLAAWRMPILSVALLVVFFGFATADAVTIDDGLYGSSQKNVTEVAGYLQANAANQPGFILISVASHDAIIFTSHLPMKRYIHEGTGAYWESAVAAPDRWARWIVMRTNDTNDSTWRLVSRSPGFTKFELVDHYEFADIYRLKAEYLPQLKTAAAFK